MKQINRREVLMGVGATTLTGCVNLNTPSILNQQNHVLSGVDVTLTGDLEIEKKVQQTISSNTQEDINLFKKMFCTGNCSSVDLYNAIVEKQRTWKLSSDGIVGPQTLKYIYLSAASRNEQLSFTQRKRLTVYGDLENYESDRGRTPTSVPDVFNNRKFFGGGNIHDFENISGTYISQKLLDVIAERGTPNTLYIGRLQGRMIMRLYDAQGNIYIANYITGGTSAHKSPENITYKTGWTDKYHISSSYPEEGTRGAPMYAATNVNGGPIWVHSSADTIDGYDHSHGCYRAGLLYAKALFEYVSKQRITIKIGDLY